MSVYEVFLRGNAFCKSKCPIIKGTLARSKDVLEIDTTERFSGFSFTAICPKSERRKKVKILE